MNDLIITPQWKEKSLIVLRKNPNNLIREIEKDFRALNNYGVTGKETFRGTYLKSSACNNKLNSKEAIHTNKINLSRATSLYEKTRGIIDYLGIYYYFFKRFVKKDMHNLIFYKRKEEVIIEIPMYKINESLVSYLKQNKNLPYELKHIKNKLISDLEDLFKDIFTSAEGETFDKYLESEARRLILECTMEKLGDKNEKRID